MKGFAETLVRHDDWNIGILDTPIESMLRSYGDRPIRWLPVRPGHYAADPFGLVRDGVLHILYEDFDQLDSVGSIHHVAVAQDGVISEPEPVLKTGLHASYPFLLEYDGAIFMLPEVAAAGSLVLYESTDFPRAWRPAAVLLPGIPAVDASVIHFADRWWMFAGRLDHGVCADLFIWYAPDLLGPWTSHPSNPVKSDARSSRPGGTPFVSNGVLYRPSQDDSRIYGGRLVINEVVTLTPFAFAECPVQVVPPRPGSRYPDGLHTMSAVGRWTLIDGNRRHFVPDAIRHRLRRQRNVSP